MAGLWWGSPVRGPERLRYLLPALAAAWAAGILLADRGILGGAGAVALGAASAVVGALPVRRGRARSAAALLAAVAGGALALAVRLDAAQRSRPAAPRELTLEGTVRAVERSPHQTRLELDALVEIAPYAGASSGAVRVGAEPVPALAPAFAEALPGQRLRVRVRLRPPRGMHNPGGYDAARPLARAGVGALGRLAHPALAVRLPEREGLRPLAGLHALRRRRADGLESLGEGGALLRALALGERGALRDEVREPFARLGLSHLLAVSGLHLCLVAGFAYRAMRGVLSRSAALCARWDARVLAAAAAMCVALAFALLAGWGVPVRRAWFVVAALVLSLASGRPRVWIQPLAAAALCVLAFEPAALFLPGAQLSFAAASALAWSAQRGEPIGRSGARGGLELALRASAAAIAVTAPLAALHFGRAAPFALLANALAIPWTGFVLLPAALLAALCVPYSDSAPVAVALGAAEATARATLAGVAWGASVFGWEGALGRPGPTWIAAAALLGLGAVRARSTRLRIGGALAVSASLAAAPPAAVFPEPPRLVALDVGQGDALLVQGRTGAVLVDAGTAIPDGIDLGRRTVVPALRALGVRQLDLLVASHADLDHRGGIPAVLGALSVGEVWIPPGGRGDPGFAPVLAAAAASGVPVRERGRESAPLRAGELRVTALWPPFAIDAATRNDRSLVVRVDAGGRRVLLPGDIEAPAEHALIGSGADLRADVLVLPHHGSRTSSSRAFLRAVDASVAIASAPCWGRFGMPHADVLERAQTAGHPVWWTGRDGAVLVALGPRLAAVSFAVSQADCGEP